jgi:hypothetical protein
LIVEAVRRFVDPEGEEDSEAVSALRSELAMLEEENDGIRDKVATLRRVNTGLKEELRGLREQRFSEKAIELRKKIGRQFQNALKDAGRIKRTDVLSIIREGNGEPKLGEILLQCEKELVDNGLIRIHEGGEIEWN